MKPIWNTVYFGILLIRYTVSLMLYFLVSGLHQEGLFRVNGNVRAVENLKQHLEGGEDEDLLSVSDTCTVASLLKQYLRDLPEGLIDAEVQHALIQYYQGKNMYFLQATL